MHGTDDPQSSSRPDDARDSDRRTAPLRWGAAGFLGGAAVVGLAWSIATRSDAPPLPIPRMGDAPATPIVVAGPRASAPPAPSVDLREEPAPAALTESASATAASPAAPSVQALPGEPPASQPDPAPPPPRGLLDLNTATIEELELLPGIGPALAQRTVDDRTRRGKFLSVRDLDRVPGIGEKIIERLRPYVTVR